MKGIFSKLTLFSLLIALVTFTSCGEDEDPILGGSNITNPPTISLTSGSDLISGDASISLGDDIKIQINLLQGDNPMNSFIITEDGVNIGAGRLTFNNGGVTAQNPFLLVGDATKNAEYDITITTDANVNESRVYRITLSDDSNETDFVEFQVTVSGTLVSEITGVLLNQGGPVGTGGLNLNTGGGTGTDPNSDPEAAGAHIKDEGIDTDKVAAENWIQRIAGINGSEIRTIGANNAEGFNYDNVTTVEEIISGFDNADVLVDMNDDGELVTAVVNVGDEFVVKNGDNYWMLKVTEVNVITTDNSDNYMFSIKQ